MARPLQFWRALEQVVASDQETAATRADFRTRSQDTQQARHYAGRCQKRRRDLNVGVRRLQQVRCDRAIPCYRGEGKRRAGFKTVNRSRARTSAEDNLMSAFENAAHNAREESKRRREKCQQLKSISLSLSLYIYIYTFIYVYVCVYIYIYVHTHNYTCVGVLPVLRLASRRHRRLHRRHGPRPGWENINYIDYD